MVTKLLDLLPSAVLFAFFLTYPRLLLTLTAYAFFRFWRDMTGRRTHFYDGIRWWARAACLIGWLVVAWLVSNEERAVRGFISTPLSAWPSRDTWEDVVLPLALPAAIAIHLLISHGVDLVLGIVRLRRWWTRPRAFAVAIPLTDD